MAFIQKRVSGFLSWQTLFASTLVLAASVPLSPAFTQEPLAQSPAKPIVCPMPPGFRGVGRDLSGVVLDIEIDNRYIGALDCHGQQKDCDGRSGLVSHDASYLQMLKDNYDKYPKPLHPDALIALIRPLIEKRFAARLVPDEKCRAPEIKVFSPIPYSSRPSSREFEKAVSRPASLTFYIRVDIFDDTKPRIAVLSSHLFQPVSITDNRVFVQPIPLDISDGEMTKTVTSYVHKIAD